MGSQQQPTACTGRKSTLSQSDKNSQSHSTGTLSSAHRNSSSLHLGCQDTAGTWCSCGPFPTGVVQAAEPLKPTAPSAAGVLLPRFLSFYCFCTACCCSFSWLTSSSAYTLKRGTGSCNKAEDKPRERSEPEQQKGEVQWGAQGVLAAKTRGRCDWVLFRG